MTSKTAETEAFRQAYLSQGGAGAADYEVVRFGDTPAIATELVELVLAGTKRATASLRSDFASDEALPRIGGHVVVVDGTGAPRCIWRTTEITVKPLDRVDARFAWDGGEGDRTLAGWLAAHHAYFGAQAAREGFEMRDDIETVFERFEIVWPPEAADGRSRA